MTILFMSTRVQFLELLTHYLWDTLYYFFKEGVPSKVTRFFSMKSVKILGSPYRRMDDLNEYVYQSGHSGSLSYNTRYNLINLSKTKTKIE